MCISWPGFSNRHFAPVLTEDVGCPISISTFHKALQDCTQLIIQMPYLSLFKNCQYHLLQFARALSREGQGQRLAPCGEESPQRLGSALLGTPGPQAMGEVCCSTLHARAFLARPSLLLTPPH